MTTVLIAVNLLEVNGEKFSVDFGRNFHKLIVVALVLTLCLLAQVQILEWKTFCPLFHLKVLSLFRYRPSFLALVTCVSVQVAYHDFFS